MKTTKDFDRRVLRRASSRAGVAFAELNEWSGRKGIPRWYRYIQDLAASHNRVAGRYHDAEDRRCTRFVIDKPGRPVHRTTIADKR